MSVLFCGATVTVTVNAGTSDWAKFGGALAVTGMLIVSGGCVSSVCVTSYHAMAVPAAVVINAPEAAVANGPVAFAVSCIVSSPLVTLKGTESVIAGLRLAKAS